MNYDEKLEKIFTHYGFDHQIFKLFEELGELTVELGRYCTGLGDRLRIAEEIGDVVILLQQMIIHFEIADEVESDIAFKVSRQLERIERGE